MTEHPTFSLIDQPWIRIITTGGTTEEVGLVDAFHRAPDIARIVGEVPTQSFAILRLLLAVLHRASNGPPSVDEWADMRDHWPDVAEAAADYLAGFADRFDLRHPTTPFFQVADLRSAKGAVSGLEKLIADVPNGEPYLTTRLGRGVTRIGWPEAARWLVHVQAYDPNGIRTGAVGDPRAQGGKGYPIGPAWAGQIGGLYLVGNTLAETLLLNLVVARDAGIESGEGDVPVWERPAQDQRADDTHDGQPRGPIDLYSWQARRVRLVGDDGGVTGAVLAQGDRMTPQNRQSVEPMSSWRFSEPQTKKHGHVTYMPRLHDPARALWRGLPALLEHVTATSSGSDVQPSLPAAVLAWAALLRSRRVITDDLIRLHAVGVEYGAQQATFAEIVDDELVLPTDVLVEPGLAQVVQDAVRAAEAAVNQLAFLAQNVAQAAGASGEDDGPRSRAREAAYSALEAPFRQWVAGLVGASEVRTAEQGWQETVREILLRSRARLVEAAPAAAWAGRTVRDRTLDVGLADRWFLAGLRKALPLAAPGDQHPSAPPSGTNALTEESA